MALFPLCLIVAGAYLLGAIPFGWLVARMKGVDILRLGSGNIGATNVGRVLGRRYGILVFILDFAKGAVPAAFATWWEIRFDGSGDLSLPPDSLRVAAGLAAFLGHLFPVYLRFKGGKGVATGAGVVAILLPAPLFVGLLAWVTVLSLSRYVSLASVTAAVALTLFRIVTALPPFQREHIVLTSFCLLASILVVVRHAANLRRLVQGSENRLKESDALVQFQKTVHVLALGLWFGSAVFFTLSGLLISHAFEKFSLQEASERPLWFPLPSEYERKRPSDKFPEPLRKEQGSRAFGVAVAPLFEPYYGLQFVCGILAYSTASPFRRSGRTVDRVRPQVVVAALIGVLAGYSCYLRIQTGGLTEARNSLTEDVLKESAPTDEQIRLAEAARAEFGRVHGYSLLCNLVVLVLVTAATGMAAALPSASAALTGREPDETSSPKKE
jgi:acyl-phosphate glycerol 3-phosphate acyltransferase